MWEDLEDMEETLSDNAHVSLVGVPKWNKRANKKLYFNKSKHLNKRNKFLEKYNLER